MLPSLIIESVPRNIFALGLHNMLKTYLKLLGLFLILSGFSAPAIAELGKVDRAAMQQAIKQYIMNNPEVVRDALMALAAREKQALAQDSPRYGVMMVTPLWAMLMAVWLSMNFLIITAAIANGCSLPCSNCWPTMMISAWW